MTYVVTEACIKCKYMDCVEECPTDCFHEGNLMLVINPENCIDCGICEDYCPVEAIVSDKDLNDTNYVMLKINTQLSKKWPIITKKGIPPSDADVWKEVTNKLSYIDMAVNDRI